MYCDQPQARVHMKIQFEHTNSYCMHIFIYHHYKFPKGLYKMIVWTLCSNST